MFSNMDVKLKQKDEGNGSSFTNFNCQDMTRIDTRDLLYKENRREKTQTNKQQQQTKKFHERK